MVTGNFDFSRILVTIQSTEWQAHLRDLLVSLFFEKYNFARRGSNPGCKNKRESTLTVRLRGPLMFVNVMFNSVLGIFYSF